MWVDDAAGLRTALTCLGDPPWLGIDTEFMRERTYFPQLCLVQLAAPAGSVLIDPLAVTDLSDLARFLAAVTAEKVLHAARQDLEVLQCAGISLGGYLFDTQIAAALLGHPDQVSYAWLVEQYCGVALDKSQTRTDWARRPLSDAQLRYAAADVTHLGVLHARLRAALEEAGKLDWLWEETAPVALPAEEAPADPSRRMRGLAALAPLAAARGRALADWRESAARKADVPRGWVLKDEVLLAIARQAPTTAAALSRIPGLPPATMRRHGAELLALGAATVAATDWPSPPPRLSKAGTRVLGELQEQVRMVAQAREVSATLLATRRDLEQCLLGATPARLQTGWRAAVLGPTLTRFLAGLDCAALQATGSGPDEAVGSAVIS